MRNQLKMQKLDPSLQQTLKENQLQRTQQAQVQSVIDY